MPASEIQTEEAGRLMFLLLEPVAVSICLLKARIEQQESKGYRIESADWVICGFTGKASKK